MPSWKLTNGEYLHIESDNNDEWSYWLYSEDGLFTDGGEVEKDHYAFPEMLAYDIASDRETEIKESVPDDLLEEFEEEEYVRLHSGTENDFDLEMGFDPYLGCYTDDC